MYRAGASRQPRPSMAVSLPGRFRLQPSPFLAAQLPITPLSSCPSRPTISPTPLHSLLCHHRPVLAAGNIFLLGWRLRSAERAWGRSGPVDCGCARLDLAAQADPVGLLPTLDLAGGRPGPAESGQIWQEGGLIQSSGFAWPAGGDLGTNFVFHDLTWASF